MMKILILNKTEQKELSRLLYDAVKQGCSYHITTILEKLSVSEYERVFDIMNAREISTNVNTNEDFKERVLKKILEYEKNFNPVDDFEVTDAIGWLYEEILQMC